MIKEKSIMHEKELITNFNKLTPSQQDRIQREIINFCNLNDRLGDNRPYQCPYCHKKTKMIKEVLPKENNDISVWSVITSSPMIHI